MNRIIRAVGYCLNENCDEFASGCFLLGQTKYYCNTCKCKTTVMIEHGVFTSEHEGVFREVRVEHNYDPIAEKYRAVAVVTDNELTEGDTYTLFSPLIKTEKRALKVAENLLSTLSYTIPELEEVPSHNEEVLNLDSPLAEFIQQLDKNAKRWKNSSLRKKE